MRIEGPRAADTVRKNEKTRKSGGASSAFSTFMEGDAAGASTTSGPAMAAGIGSLLAVQGAEDPAERKARRRMTERAEKVLDVLEDVHKGLLSGRLTPGHIDGITRAVAERREKIADPQLAAVLDEVDLRAQVELAKLEMAREQAGRKK